MMTRRNLLRAVVFAGLVAGCGQPTPVPGGTPSSATTPRDGITGSASAKEVRLALPRAPAGADPAAGATMLGTFAGSLLGAALAVEKGNLVLSPWSIAAALGMNRAGAAGRTASQIDAAMHVPASPAGFLQQAMNTGDRLLESRNERIVTEYRSGNVVLRSANSTWAARTVTWKESFLATLATYYGSGVRLADFATDAERARLEINTWVADRTEGRIRELVPPEAIDKDTLIAVVNAVYFKAPWAEPFDRDLTATKPFSLADGTRKPTSMMRVLFGGVSASGDGWRGASVPYLGGKLAMTLVLPDPGRDSDVAGWLSKGGITELLEAKDTASVDLTMPKFTYRTDLPLKRVLMALGVTDAFDPVRADYTAMTVAEPVYVTDALHQATIGVDEEGTEATAATAIIGGRGGAGPEVVLVLDRPFFFVIHDLETRIPVFVGRVADPTVTA